MEKTENSLVNRKKFTMSGRFHVYGRDWAYVNTCHTEYTSLLVDGISLLFTGRMPRCIIPLKYVYWTGIYTGSVSDTKVEVYANYRPVDSEGLLLWNWGRISRCIHLMTRVFTCDTSGCPEVRIYSHGSPK